jgi:iron-sulfur cluster repair protein YtfE (RIC family)
MRFTRISNNSTKDVPASPGPIETLLDCHMRVRHFMQLSHTLADAHGVPQKEIAQAAEDIFCYFSRNLPLHHADESESLYPRLQTALRQDSLVREAADAMVEQHQAIDELTAVLLSLCASLSRQPQRLPSMADRLGQVTRALDQIFTAHLRLEETVVFLALPELLTFAQLREMGREMHLRRQPPLGTIHLVR